MTLPPIIRGIKRGVQRLEKAGLNVSFEYVRQQVEGIVKEYTSNHEERYPDHFWDLMAESITIGVGARIADKEPSLSQEDVWSYINASVDFWNTWNHPQ